MYFEIVGSITDIETIRGTGTRLIRARRATARERKRHEG
jgi:uncharacterized DUF497 family protein